eukprot:scaffold170519_cov19-Tisochrysis_lutea.AAC.1
MDDGCDAATVVYGHGQWSCSGQLQCMGTGNGVTAVCWHMTDHGKCVSMVSGHACEEKRNLCSQQPE